MKIAVKVGLSSGPETTMASLIASAQRAEAMGFASVWMPHIFGLDAVTTMALLGHETQCIGLGTAVTPIQPRHPTALAQQALTTQAASAGRFCLGIGLSHKLVIEDMFGLSYDKPARQMREYLEVLLPLLKGEAAAFNGDLYRVNAQLNIPGVERVPVVVAALGPQMLKIAGSMADGTITWMTGHKTLAGHVVPSIVAAADAAGKPAPKVVAGLPVLLTDDESAGRQMIGEALSLYKELPSYKAMLEKEGAASAGDIALVGDEASLRSQLQALRDAGVTELNAAVMPLGEDAESRTLQFLAECG